MAKNGSDICNFCSKLDFGKSGRKHFLLFFMDFKLLMFHNNIVKVSEILNKENLLKTCLKFTYPIDFCIFCSHFYKGKKRKYSIFIPRLRLDVHVSVHLSICQLSVSLSVFRFQMINWVNINGFSSNLVCALILWRSVLELLMGKFRQILTGFNKISAPDTPIFLFPDNNM